MKRILLALLIITGCAKDDFTAQIDSVMPDLIVEGDLGLKFYDSEISDTDFGLPAGNSNNRVSSAVSLNLACELSRITSK